MLNPLQGTYLQHCILCKEPTYNAEPFARNLSATLHSLQRTYLQHCILWKEPIYDAEPFARNRATQLSLQGTYLEHWSLCKEPICNTAFFPRNLSTARNLSATSINFAMDHMASLNPLTRNLSATFTQYELKQLTRAGKHDCLETWIIAVAIICKNVAAMLATVQPSVYSNWIHEHLSMRYISTYIQY